MGHMRTVFEAAGGNEGLRRLADAWHNRVMADEVVGPCIQPWLPPSARRATLRLLGRGTRWPDYVFRFLW